MCLFNTNIMDMDIEHDAPCWELTASAEAFQMFYCLFCAFSVICHPVHVQIKEFSAFTNRMNTDFLLIDFALAWELYNHIFDLASHFVEERQINSIS